LALPHRRQRRLPEAPRPARPTQRNLARRGPTVVPRERRARRADRRLVAEPGRPIPPDRTAYGADRGDPRVAAALPHRAHLARCRRPIAYRSGGVLGSQRPQREVTRAPRPAISPDATGRRPRRPGERRRVTARRAWSILRWWSLASSLP